MIQFHMSTFHSAFPEQSDTSMHQQFNKWHKKKNKSKKKKKKKTLHTFDTRHNARVWVDLYGGLQ